MKVKLTREQAITMINVISTIAQQQVHRKFAYAMLRNKKALTPELETIQEISKPSDAQTEYEKKRIELCEKFCNLDKKGKPIIINNGYDIKEDEKEKFDNEIEKLKEEYKEALEDLPNRNEQIKELLKEEVEFELYSIDEKYLPETISINMLDILEPIIVTTVE